MTYFNLAFYTYFYGSNNNPAFRIPEIPSLKYKCYYFTNNSTMIENLKGTNWIGIYDENPTTDDIIESCMVGKYIKTMPNEYTDLKEYDYLCFLDSKLEKVNEEYDEANYNVEVRDKNEKWIYITSEFSVSSAITVAMNIHIALGQRVRVVSRRSGKKVLFDSI